MKVADFVMLMGIYVVRLILECKSLAKNENVLGTEQVEVNMGFNASFDTIAAYHQYLADIVLTSEDADIADSVGLNIDEESKIFLVQDRKSVV